MFREVETRKSQSGPAHPDTAIAQYKLAAILYKQAKVQAAQSLLLDALACARLNPTILPHTVALLHTLLGITYDDLGNMPQV